MLQLNMESASIFSRIMKKLLHLVSIPETILKGYVQDADILSLDRVVVLQMIKLRSDYYKSESIRELYQQLQTLYHVCTKQTNKQSVQIIQHIFVSYSNTPSMQGGSAFGLARDTRTHLHHRLVATDSSYRCQIHINHHTPKMARFLH